MSLLDFRRSVPGYRPSPQQPDRPLRADLLRLIHGPRIAATMPQRILVSGERPSVAPRIEDIRNPDDRNLRLSLVTRARIWSGAKGTP